MQRLLGLAAAMALVLGASAAYADQITGYIKNINPTTHTFMVGDQVFTAAANNTVAPALQKLKEGDKVTVFYEKSTEGSVSNATSITKVD
jgi:hypothetical protein